MSDETNNPFKEIETNQEVPDRLKEKVLSSINLANLLRDFTELFTARLAATAGKLMDVEEKKSQKSDPDIQLES